MDSNVQDSPFPCHVCRNIEKPIESHLSCWKTGAECLQHQGIVPDANLKILKGDFPVLVVVHLLHGHLNQVLDPLVRLLLNPRTEKRSLQQVQHFLPEKYILKG